MQTRIEAKFWEGAHPIFLHFARGEGEGHGQIYLDLYG